MMQMVMMLMQVILVGHDVDGHDMGGGGVGHDGDREDARSINDVKAGDTDEKGRRELDGRARQQ